MTRARARAAADTEPAPDRHSREASSATETAPLSVIHKDKFIPTLSLQSAVPGPSPVRGPLSASRVFVSAFVGTKGVEVVRTMDRLSVLDDPQVELLLLRACMGLCRMVYVLRCSPPRAVDVGVAVFDDGLHSGLRRIVVGEEGGFGPLQEDIASLPLSSGGLGITRAKEEDLHRECPDVHQGWYLDDGTFVGPVPAAQQAVQLVVDWAPAYGLSLNPHKCRVWSPRPNPQHLDGFPLGFVNETRAGLIVLGAAVTVSVEYAASVAQAHVDAVAASLQRLPILRNPQAELLLLRSCLGTCKVVFTARTMPPAAAAQALVTFDMLQTQVLESIVTAGGGGFGPLQQTLAGLPIAQGGLGVTKATSLLPYAYLASVTQTAPLQDRLLGTSTAPLVPAALAAKADYCALVPDFDAALFEDPDFVRSKVQARLSKPLSHRAYREVLDDPAPSDRDRAVLQSFTQPGASDWLLDLPVPHLQQTMPPESFRCRIQYQLLIPIFHPGSQCPCCLRELDVWGDHAVHCTSGENVALVGRHYSVRNGLDAVLTSARQRVTPEPAFPTPVPGQERSRADLRLHAWEEGRDLYIDIVGSSPLTVANLQHFVPGGAATRAAQDKQTRYAVLLSRQQPPVAFQAFAFETLGGLHADALALLQSLQGLLNQAIIAQEDVEGYFVIRLVSFIIAAAVGRQLAARRV
eukprot:jgi/Botrbrau1/9068/Bobra.0376s0038.1